MMDNQYWYEEQKQQHFSDADKRQRGRRVSVTTLVVCMLITGLLGGALGGQIVKSGDTGLYTQATPAPAAVDQTASVPEEDNKPVSNVVTQAGNGVYTKAQIVQLAAPSIVGIDVEGTRTDWYGRSETTTGSGSGVIISADGYIITNNHVIEGAKGIKVYLSDDTEYDAELIGSDQKTDLAVIKIDAANLTPVMMGDSDALMVGEDVVAIGNPLGELRGTATSGMVSALSRTITIENQEMTLLQTDAAINPGNSGGGLFNARGQLIGIINAKVAASATEGLGFAIPVNDAKAVISDLIDLGYVSGRAYLGVYTQNVAIQPEGADGRNGGDLFGIFEFGPGQSVETRVQVAEIVKGSAAENAGIRAGDLIVEVDGKKISTGSELASAISEYKAGDTATIEVQRGNEEISLTVTFGEYVPE